MKVFYRFFNYALALVTVVACDKSRPMPTRSWGYFEAQMNGKKWHETYENAYQRVQAVWEKSETNPACKNLVASLACNLFSSQGALRQEFIFSKVPIQLGKYSVVPYPTRSCVSVQNVDAVLYTAIDDGDVGGDSYKVLKSANNYITIEEYIPSTQEIRGRFQVTFVLHRIAYGHFLPDTLRFTDGRFHTKFLSK